MFYRYSINYIYSVNIIIIYHSLSGTHSTSYILYIYIQTASFLAKFLKVRIHLSQMGIYQAIPLAFRTITLYIIYKIIFSFICPLSTIKRIERIARQKRKIYNYFTILLIHSTNTCIIILLTFKSHLRLLTSIHWYHHDISRTVGVFVTRFSLTGASL